MSFRKHRRLTGTHGATLVSTEDRDEMKDPNAEKAPILAVGLVVCLAGGVLAFGGVTPLSWATVNFVAFLLFAFLLWNKEARNPQSPWPWRGPLLLLLYVSVQVALVHPDTYLVREEVLRLGACLSVFYVALFVSSSKTSRGVLLAGLLTLGLLEALYGLVQYVSGWQQIFTYKKVFYLAQATGTYINPNHFAGLLEMILPLCFAGTLYRLERVGTGAGNPRQTSKHPVSSERVAALVFFFFSTSLLYAAVLFSRSRTGILSASMSIVATAILWLSTSQRRSRTTLVVTCLLAAACLFGPWIGLGPVVERYETVLTDYPSRLAVWKDSLALIRAHPVRGNGLGSFADAYTRVQSTSLSRVVDHAHNDYLEFAAEWGIPGAALLMGLILWLLARTVVAGFRLAESATRAVATGCFGSILALLLHSVADFNLQIPANDLVFAAILGLAYSASAGIAWKRERT